MDVAMKHTPEGLESHEWFPEGRCQERSTQKAYTVRNSNCWYRVWGVGGPSSWSVKPTWKISRRGGTVELIRKTHMESFSSKFVFTGKGANSPSRGHLQRESPDTLEKPQRTVEPWEPCRNHLANLVTLSFIFLLCFLRMIDLLDNPAVHSSTQELSAGTFTAPVTGLFVGHPPVTRGMAPCYSSVTDSVWCHLKQLVYTVATHTQLVKRISGMAMVWYWSHC